MNTEYKLLHTNHINLPHNSLCLRQCFDDALVMADILKAEHSPLPVFEPLLCGLITADLELPYCRWDTIEILGFVDVQLTFLIVQFAHDVVAADGIACQTLFNGRTFEQGELP